MLWPVRGMFSTSKKMKLRFIFSKIFGIGRQFENKHISPRKVGPDNFSVWNANFQLFPTEKWLGYEFDLKEDVGEVYFFKTFLQVTVNLKINTFPRFLPTTITRILSL